MVTTAEDLASRLTDIAKFDIEQDLIQNAKLGSAGDFSPWKGLFEEILQFAAQYPGLPWQILPGPRLGTARDRLQRVQRTLERVQSFSPDPQRGETREDLAAQVRKEFDSFKEEVFPSLSHLRLESIGLDELQQRLDRTDTERRDLYDQLSRDAQSKMSEMDEALGQIRAGAAEAGVTQVAGTFRTAASRYESRASRWLRGSVISLIGTVVAAVLLVVLWKTDGAISNAGVLQIVLVKGTVVAVLSYATVAAVRLYRSNAHLAAVNHHRVDALRTFRTFVEGTDSNEVKDRVLLAAAYAAFGQTATGLIGETADGSNTLQAFEALFGRSVKGS